jgi:hypothetical protein
MRKNESEFISLGEAAENCPYSADYLKLRARQGKLKAKKIGRIWVTQKNWLEIYLREMESYWDEKKNGKKANLWEMILTSGKKARTEEKKHPFALLPACGIGCLTLLFFAIVIGASLNQPYDIFYIRNSFYSYCYLVREISLPTHREVTAFLLFPNDLEKELGERPATEEAALVFSTSKISQAEKKEGEEKKPNSLAEKLREISYNLRSDWQAYKLGLVQLKNDFVLAVGKSFAGIKKIGEKFARIKIKIFETEITREGTEKKETTEEVATVVVKEGLVVLPSSGEENDEEIKKKIKESFSDEVVVEIDETKESGVIKPIFKKTSDQEYIYILVPLSEN